MQVTRRFLGGTSCRHWKVSPVRRAAMQAGSGRTLETVTLIAEPITPETFQLYGQLIGPTADGKCYDEEDAQLNLANGTPRFYIMRLPKRGLRFDRITYHNEVTQCLGTTNQDDWYMAVSAPSSMEQPPTAESMKVFRIPPGVFVKMREGTWHAGPLFQEAEHMDFFNLELADTNQVDHNTHVFSEHGVEFQISDDR